jgi:trk system potassium uptake protein TrkH
MPVKSNKLSFRFSTQLLILLSFLVLILLGTLLLMLPIATRSGEGAALRDAAFTAVSAVCVTGLVVQDTATYWSGFGHAVLMLLIQVGGMGVVTVAMLISGITGRKIGFLQRTLMKETISAPQVGGIVRLTGFIIRTTLLLEGLGAAALMPAFCARFGFWKGLWLSLFHAISAFCNAGFDLMGTEAARSASLTAWDSSWLVNLVVILLITVGGIGFLVWNDVRTNGLRLRKYSLQSKVVLLCSLVLIVVPAGYLFVYDFAADALSPRLLHSLFQSVTLRTAGFNTVDLSSCHSNTLALMILMMLVGGSPGSTAGGLKTTTLSVLVLTAISVLRRRAQPRVFGRRIPVEAVYNAMGLLALYLFLFVFGAMLICRLEGLPILSCLFETASAIGTVGLTLGITPQLGTVSRLILMLLMYFGRVGGLTIIYAAVRPDLSGAKLPEERITVG